MIFQSILLHGHVMSRAYMEKLKNPQFVADSVLHHSRIRRIDELKKQVIEKLTRRYIVTSVKQIFQQKGLSVLLSDDYAYGGYEGDSTGSTDLAKSVKHLENDLSRVLRSSDVKAISEKTKEIAEDSIKLNSNPTGIGFGNDKVLETDKTVFSILGPHLGHYYGDIIIVFKREILHHPDTNVSLQAATTYLSGRAFQARPWLGHDPGNQADQLKIYHKTKYSAAVPGYDHALALELMALTSFHMKKKSLDITLDDILKRWFEVDSHMNLEAHLPQLIPISYIDYIYIPKNVNDMLSEASKTAINAMFKNRVKIVDHDGFGDQPTSFVPNPKAPEKSRDDFHQEVARDSKDKLLKAIKNKYIKTTRGITITLPPSEFIHSYLLPMTITQAFDNYRFSRHTRGSQGKFYIYWQIIGGDMMLSLSDNRITSDESKTKVRCLSCYIARKPSSSDATHYHENLTYINDTLPIKHSLVQDSNQLAGKSNQFFIGCDTDHPITLCLEVDRSSGRVTLSHAGPNALYSREKISHQFNKAKLDVGTLNYIYISSGSHVVPVTNLFVTFERIDDLHPSTDKDCNWNNAVLDEDEKTKKPDRVDDDHPIRRRKKSDEHKRSRSRDKNTEDDDSPSRKSSKGIGGIIKDAARNFIDFFVSSDDTSSTMKICPDNVNCLLQYSKSEAEDHNAEFLHPCRFSELCTQREPHFTHEKHDVPKCKEDKSCGKLDDPYHRAQYRHTGLPDYLYPCRKKNKCPDIKREDHCIKYSHGENVYQPNNSKEKCQYGAKCRNIDDKDHCRRFAHPSSSPSTERKTDCQYGAKCRNIDDKDHCRRFAHPSSSPSTERKTDCQYGAKCRNIDDKDHCRRFAHPSSSKNPCQYGSRCHDHTAQHRQRFQHP